MNLKQKVLIVTSEFPPLPGGIGNHAYNLSLQLSRNGKNVTVVTDQRESGNNEKNFDKNQSFKILRVPLRKVRLLMYLERLIKVFLLVKESDVIIASGKFSLWIVSFVKLFYRRNKKFIAVIHGTEVNLKNKWLKKLTNRSLVNIGNVISVSNYTSSLVKHLNLKDLSVIPNGYNVDVSIDIKGEKLEGDVNLVTVGRVSERKGQINVIKALPELKKLYPNIKYHIIGIPEDKNRLIKEAKKIGVDNNIIFYGQINNSKLYNVVNGSDIFMMLSQNDRKGDVEGFGIAILEANHFGIPAIGSKNCGIEDAINDSSSGILVFPDSVDEIKNAVETIINNKIEFSTNAKKWSEQFTWNKIIKEYLKKIH